jgi:hypothetical protein
LSRLEEHTVRLAFSTRYGFAGRTCVAIAITALAAGSALWAQQPPLPAPVRSSDSANRQGRQVSLFDQLRVGLKARTKADIDFLEEVVDEVNDGRLPRKMVDATFLWARNRYKTRPTNHRLRPIVYFQPALTAQAKKIGVIL